MLTLTTHKEVVAQVAHRDRARFRILVVDGDFVHGDDLAFALTTFGLPSCSARTLSEGAEMGDFDVVVDYTGAPADDLRRLSKTARACLVMAGKPIRNSGMPAWEARVLDWQITCALKG